MNKNHSQTIVIGGGIAGLKATIELTKAGIPTRILEARDRLGGRLHSVETDGGNIIDIGASWFHDCLTNPLLEKYYLKRNLGDQVHFAFDDAGLSVYDVDGEINVKQAQIEPVSEEIKMYLKHVISEKPVDQDISLREACLNYLKSKKYILSDIQLKYAHQLIRYYELWIGSSWNDISARNIAADDHLGRDALVLNGYKTVYNGELKELLQLLHKDDVEEIMGSNNSGVSFHLNTEVFNIAKNEQTGQIEISTRSLLTNESIIYTCDYLIVTAPLSILSLTDPKEKGCITWSPPLPHHLRRALNAAEFSHLGKVFMEFPREFWPQKDRLYVMADPDLSFNHSLNTDTALTSEKLDTSVLTKGKGQQTSPVLFINVANVLRRNGDPNPSPLILCLVSESLTKQLELQYRANNNDGVMKLLAPSLARISNILVSQIPKPSYVRVTEWSFDQYARGSYTGLPVAADLDYPDMVAALENPRGIFGESGVSRVRFAGEGIINEGNGCVHAAWSTGAREADVITKLVNRARL